jgi:hypothetical protein
VATAKPKKKPFLSVGAPGQGSPRLASGMWPEKQAKAQKARNPLQGGTAGAAAVSPSGPQLEPNPVGRPKTNIGNYLIKPSANALSGYEMLNDTPDALDSVHKKYLKNQELPPHLQPARFISPVLEHGVLGRATNISRGWRKPRSRAG